MGSFQSLEAAISDKEGKGAREATAPKKKEKRVVRPHSARKKRDGGKTMAKTFKI